MGARLGGGHFVPFTVACQEHRVTDYSQTRDGKVGTETQRNMGFIHGTPCTVRGFLLTPEPRLRYLVRGAEREGGGVEEERERCLRLPSFLCAPGRGPVSTQREGSRLHTGKRALTRHQPALDLELVLDLQPPEVRRWASSV